MKSNNLESTIKDKLNERSIQPKENSWDRLDAMLTIAETKPVKRNWNWLYMAASFIGLLLMVTVFLNRNDKAIEPENTVVIENNTPEIPTENSIKKGRTIEKEVIRPKIYRLATAEPKSTKITPNNTIQTDSINKHDLAYAERNKIATIVSVHSITDADVSMLLTEAQSSLKQNKIASVKVDPLQLLNQVDEPVLVTFKDKALHAITENYKTIQTAVSTRNQ